MYIGKYTSINENSKKTRERRGKQTVTIFSKPTSSRVKFVTYLMCTRVPPLILLPFRSRYDSELLWWAYTVVCLSVCLSARISQEPHVLASPKLRVHVTYGRGSVLLWRRCDTVVYFRFCGWRHVCPAETTQVDRSPRSATATCYLMRL